MARTAKTDTNARTSKIIGVRKKVKEVTLELPPPHSKEQDDLINGFDKYPGTRFIVGACGSKFGKSYGCAIRFCQEAWTNENPYHLLWWVAPSYKQTEIAYHLVKRMLPRNLVHEQKGENRLILLNPDGSERSYMEFKTGEDPDNLRGFAVKFFVLDEAARIPFDSCVSVRTTTTQTMGRGIIISTPKGRGHFYNFFKQGQHPDFAPEWRSLRLPTWVNPTVSDKAILEMRRDMPEDVFRQEVAAEFLLDSAGVFKNIRNCTFGVLEPPMPGRRYVVGVDLARIRDYTVITVMDVARRHVVYHFRCNDTKWEQQYALIRNVCLRYNYAPILCDATGLGGPVVETLQTMGLPAEGYVLSPKSKPELIGALQMAIENNRISFPYIPVLDAELAQYEYETTKTGQVTMNAPAGFHDDCVISLALANWHVGTGAWVYRYFNQRGI